MADRPDFAALAHAIALAAGRMAHGSYAVADVTDKLAADLAAAWPPDDPCYDITPQEIARHEWLGEIARQNEAWKAHEGTIAEMPAAPVSPVDTPAQHIAWATELLDQMSDAGMDHRQSYAVSEALGHLRRASELISDEVWADAPAGLEDDELPEQHGPHCSSDPAIGCVCGLAERQSEEDEYRNAPDQRPVVDRLAAEMAETAAIAARRFPNDYAAAVRYVRDLVSEEGA